MRSSTRYAPLLLSLALAACSPAEDRAGSAGEESEGLVVLALDTASVLEIGRLEGDANYVLGNVVGAERLASGELAVADAGASEIRIYSEDGTFVRRVGRRGQGPGEFTDLARVYRGPGDSILAGTGYPMRVLVFDGAGEYARQAPASDFSGDSIFALDSWLHRRFWVEGVLHADGRARVNAALDALQLPQDSPRFRRVKVAESGTLWIEEPELSPAGTRSWTLMGFGGTPTATIDLPVQFEPLEIRGGSITGRWIGEGDVHYVRVYTTRPTDARRAEPSWIRAAAAPSTEPPLSDEAFAESVRVAIRSMAGQQERYYSRNYSYTTVMDSLEWVPPEGVEAHFISADERGWGAVFTSPRLDRICALAYGFNMPAGWTPGYVRCAPPPAAPAPGA